MTTRKSQNMHKPLLVIIEIVLPPLAVGRKAGVGFHLFLDIVITLLLYIPGLLHALWIMLNEAQNRDVNFYCY